ncbi:MAG: GyrI-like domain-containing protein, partial [Methanotrichaceae archaeon]
VKGEGMMKSSKLPGGKTATALHIGPYDKLAEAYKAVESWIRDNGYQIAGNSWETYLSMPYEEPSKIRTQIFWPVK